MRKPKNKTTSNTKREKRTTRVRQVRSGTKVTECDSYKTFPGVKQELGVNQLIPFETDPQIFHSLSRKTYIYKHDVLTKLQQLVAWCFGDNAAIYPLVVFYLRTKSIALEGCCELVEYDENHFLDLESRILTNTCYRPAFRGEPGKYALAVVVEQAKMLLNKNPRDPGLVSVYKHFMALDREHPISEDNLFYEDAIMLFCHVKEQFDKFFKWRPDWFRPFRQGKSTTKPIVRLFKDASKSQCKMFVLCWELLKEMENAGLSVPPKVRSTIEKKEKLDVFLFNELFELLGDQMKLIEFVQVGTSRIWDPHPPGMVYVTNSGYYLMTIIKNEIRVNKVFYGATKQQTTQLVRLFEYVVVVLDKIMVGPHLFNNALFVQYSNLIYENFEPYHHNITFGSTGHIRQNGFNTKDVQREVQRFGLLKTMPGIMAHVNHAMMVAKGKWSDPAHFQHGLAKAQIRWLIHSSRILQEFLHRTEYCDYMGPNCPGCLRGNMARVYKKMEQARIKNPLQAKIPKIIVEINVKTNEMLGYEEVFDDLDTDPAQDFMNLFDLPLEKNTATEICGSEKIATRKNEGDPPAAKYTPEEIKARKSEKRKRQAEKKKQAKQKQAPLETKKEAKVETCARCAKNGQLHNKNEKKLKQAHETINQLSKQLAGLEMLKLENDITIQKLRDENWTQSVLIHHYEETEQKSKGKTDSDEERLKTPDTAQKPTVASSEKTNDSDSGRTEPEYLLYTDTAGGLLKKMELHLLECDLRDLKKIDLVGRARQIVEQLAGPKHNANKQLKQYEEKVKRYKNAIDRSIAFIQSHPDAHRDDVPKITNLPVFKVHIEF